MNQISVNPKEFAANDADIVEAMTQ